MYNTLFFVALFAATFSGVFATFSIGTPKFTQCQPATISWSQGQGPYHLVVVDTKDPCGNVILDIGEFKETSISWTVQLPTNADVTLYVEDSGTNDAWSGPITVLASNDQTCIPASVRHHYNLGDPTPSPSSSSKAGSGTLAVSPTFSAPANSDPTSAPANSGPSPAPIGAANAGTNPLHNGAPSNRRVGTPLATIGALVAAILFVL